MIVSVLNPKGGSGKTTLSVNLARAFREFGRSVLLVDTDPQGSARDWHAAHTQNPIDLVALDRPAALRTLETVSRGYDLVVADGAAKLEDMIAAAVRVSDWILIPLQPSPYDVWAVSDLVDLVAARREVTGGVPNAAFVVTRRIEGTRLGEDVREALAEYPLPTFRASVVQRQVYPRTAAGGGTVFDPDGNAPARSEMLAVAAELLAAADREMVKSGETAA